MTMTMRSLRRKPRPLPVVLTGCRRPRQELLLTDWRLLLQVRLLVTLALCSGVLWWLILLRLNAITALLGFNLETSSRGKFLSEMLDGVGSGGDLCRKLEEQAKEGGVDPNTGLPFRPLVLLPVMAFVAYLAHWPCDAVCL